MAERESALTAFAAERAGHTWGRDQLCDQVIIASECGTLQRAGGIEDQDRGFLRLLFVYNREKRHADKQFFAKMMGAR